jgi:4'-phosphopantetheinyl transferase
VIPTLLTTIQHHAAQVAVWHCDLSIPVSDHLLSPDEQARAQRLRIPEKRQRFVAARTALRRVLADTTGQPAESLIFGYGPQGKPYLVNAHACYFNLAHSEDTALIAVAGGSVGIDLEHLRPLPSMVEMAQIAFSPQEQDALASLPDTERLSAFFRIWTRKEALMKARGEGFRLARTFSLPLDFHVGCFKVEGWTLYDIPLTPVMFAAVAVAMPA